MINSIKNLFAPGPRIDYTQLVKDGAAIIDVRTKGEYQQGHIKGSLNLPLNHLADNLAKLPKEKAIILCCASGMRSAQAKSILKAKGFTEVHDGGGWSSLQNKI
jgi:phage shock protein E